MGNSVSRRDTALGGEARLLVLERLWSRHFSTYEHTRDDEARREAQILLREIEQDMARIPAETYRGLAAKLRCCVNQEALELEQRPWFDLIQSLMTDIEG